MSSGEKSHLRDQAMFYFKVKNNVKKSLELAKENFEIQKEPADVKLLLNIAIADGDRSVADEISLWASRQSLEDYELNYLLKQAAQL